MLRARAPVPSAGAGVGAGTASRGARHQPGQLLSWGAGMAGAALWCGGGGPAWSLLAEWLIGVQPDQSSTRTSESCFFWGLRRSR